MSEGLYAAIAAGWAAGPDEIAILEEHRAWTRADLRDLSARLDGALRAAGARPGAPVCLIAEKSVATFCAYLACIRGGYAFFPINAGYTDAEIDYLLEDARPTVVVVDPSRASGVEPLAAAVGARLLTLDRAGSGSLADAAEAVASPPAPHEGNGQTWAALLYTSGTTGKPKGAVLSHANLLSNARALVAAWKFTQGDVLLHVLPIFHVHGLFVAGNIAMLSGARLLWRPAFDPAEVVARLPEVTAFMGVPTLYTRLLGQEGLTADLCAHMRLFVSGSAPLDPITFEAFRARTGKTILERYGMTETGMLASNPYDGERIAGSVGYPLEGVELRVCAEGTAEAAPGEIGVVQVRGPNIFGGYLNAPEKTAAAFTEDGFFVTGDLGRLQADGRLFLVGRQSDLIISGGYNVYPSEVEGVLTELDGVAEAAVFGVRHPDFGEAVVAAVASLPGADLSEAQMVQACRGKLAAYKTPKRIFSLEALPRNAMGKTDRKVLRTRFADVFGG